MTSAIMVSLCFVAFAVALLLVMLFIKLETVKRFRKFFVATEGIYLSGTVLILIICIVLRDMPVSFSLISQGLIFLVFIFTVLMLNLVATKAQNYEQNQNNSEETH